MSDKDITQRHPWTFPMEPDRGTPTWKMRFDRRFWWIGYVRIVGSEYIRAFWPTMVIGAATFLVGYIAGHYL